MLAVIALLLMTLDSSFATSAPTKKNLTQKKTSSHQPSLASNRYSTKPVDMSSEQLGPNYYGHNIEALFVRLSAGRTKSEFETTAEYNRRLEQMTSSATLGSLTYSSIYAFLVEDPRFEPRYDADNGILVASVHPSAVWKEDTSIDESRSALTSKTKLLQSREHMGTNALGARVKMKSISSYEYGIAFSNVDDFLTEPEPNEPLETASHVLVFRLSMGPAEAQRAKSNLRILAVCRLVSPYVTSGMFFNGATFDHPTEVFGREVYIHTFLLELWAFDLSSGRVFAKIRPAKNSAGLAARESSTQPEGLREQAESLIRTGKQILSLTDFLLQRYPIEPRNPDVVVKSRALCELSPTFVQQAKDFTKRVQEGQNAQTAGMDKQMLNEGSRLMREISIKASELKAKGFTCGLH